MHYAPRFFNLIRLGSVSRGDHRGLSGIERGLGEESAGDVIASFTIQGGEVIGAIEYRAGKRNVDATEDLDKRVDDITDGRLVDGSTTRTTQPAE
jgi:hypothetical protein